METWLVKYTMIPTAHNRPANAVVEAETAEDAKDVLRRALGDVNGVHNYALDLPVVYVAPKVVGRVLSLGGDVDRR